MIQFKIQAKAGMVETEAIQPGFTQVAIWAATTVVMAMREVDSGHISGLHAVSL